MRSTVLLCRAAAGTLVFVTFVAWGWREISLCGEVVETFGLLSYYTVSTAGGSHGLDKHANVSALGLTGTLLLTGFLLAAAWKLWTAGSAHAKQSA